MVKAFLASTNQHKVEEISGLVSPELLTLLTPDKKLDVIEDGQDFHENALKKAKAYFDCFDSPSLSDDSGIVVEALPDELGIYSARFGQKELTSQKNGGQKLTSQWQNELLLTKLQGVTARNAYYICVICLYLSDEEIFFFEGRLHGEIADEASGDGGFGYDPLFIPTGQSSSLATLSEWKSKNSHRAKACKQMESFLQGHKKDLDI